MKLSSIIATTSWILVLFSERMHVDGFVPITYPNEVDKNGFTNWRKSITGQNIDANSRGLQPKPDAVPFDKVAHQIEAEANSGDNFGKDNAKDYEGKFIRKTTTGDSFGKHSGEVFDSDRTRTRTDPYTTPSSTTAAPPNVSSPTQATSIPTTTPFAGIMHNGKLAMTIADIPAGELMKYKNKQFVFPPDMTHFKFRQMTSIANNGTQNETDSQVIPIVTGGDLRDNAKSEMNAAIDRAFKDLDVTLTKIKQGRQEVYGWSDEEDERRRSIKGFYYDTLERLFFLISTDCPSFIRHEIIGHSFDKKPIHSFIVGKQNPVGRVQKKNFTILSGLYGNEAGAFMTNYHLLQSICDDYKKPQASHVLQPYLKHYVFHFIPFANPDGITYSQMIHGKHIRNTQNLDCNDYRRRTTPTCCMGSNLNNNFKVYDYQVRIVDQCSDYHTHQYKMEAETTAITSYLEYTKPFALIDLHGDGNKIVLPDAQIGSNKYRSTKHLSLPTISLRRGLMKEFNYTYERGTNKEVNGISLEGSAINFAFHKFNTPFSVAIHMFKTPASMNRPNFEQQFLVYQDQVNFVFNHIINATLNYTGSEWSYESSGVGTTNIWWSFTISLTVLLTFHLIF